MTKISDMLRPYMTTRTGLQKIAASLKAPLRIVFNYMAPHGSPYAGLGPQQRLEERLRLVYEDLAVAGEKEKQSPHQIEWNLRTIHEAVVLPEGCGPVPFERVWTQPVRVRVDDR